MAATNLNQYYQSIGQALPSLQARAGLYSQYGLGGGYQGTVQQNTSLLGKLQGGGGPSSSSTPSIVPNTSTAQGSAADQSLVNFNNQYSTDYNSLLNNQNKTQQDLFGQYQNAVNGQEKLGDAYNRLSQQNGLPDMQQGIATFKGQIYNLKNLLNNLDQNVSDRTNGTFTTEAQREHQVAAEGVPLQTQLTGLGNALEPLTETYNTAQQSVQNQLNWESQDQQKQLQPMQMQINSLSDRFSREITGFTSEKQNQLNTLMDSIQRNRQLSDQQWQLAADLSKQEQAFQQNKQLQSMQMTNAIKVAGISAGAGIATAKQTGINDQNLANLNYQNQLKLIQQGGQNPYLPSASSSGSGNQYNSAYQKYFG